MIQIYKDIKSLKGETEVLFIRYNPDNYRGIQFTREERRSKLLGILNWAENLSTINTSLGVIYMFYNDYNGTEHIKSVDINNSDFHSSGKEEEEENEDNNEDEDEDINEEPEIECEE
jgi:hypothetical protein